MTIFTMAMTWTLYTTLLKTSTTITDMTEANSNENKENEAKLTNLCACFTIRRNALNT